VSEPSETPRAARPLLGPEARRRAGAAVLLLAGLLALAGLARPLARASLVMPVLYLLAIAAGGAAAALLAAIKRHRWPEELAFYAFLTLGLDALGQILLAAGWPAWPALALLVASVGAAEPARNAAVVAGLASLLALARAGASAEWQSQVAAALAYPVLALVLNRATRSDRSRLERALTELARVRHGIDQFEEGGAAPGEAPPEGLRQVSEERRRARRLEHDSVVERTLQELVEVARRATGAQAVVYLAVDREQDLAFVKAADGPETLVREATLALGEDPIAFVLDRKTSFYATDFERLLGSLPWYRPPARVGTLLAVPVLTGDVAVGVLVADRAEIQGFTGSEPELLESFARLVAADLSRTRAAVSSAEQTVELGALANVSAQLAEQVERRGVYRLLLKSAQELVSFESAAILRTDDAETRYVVEAATGWAREFKGREVALAERTWSAWVLRSAQEPYVLDDLAEAETRMPLLVLDEGGGRAESLLAVPLRSANTSLGALILTGRRGSFDATANRVLKILASQTAAVLKTIWLVEQRTELAVRDGLTGLYNRRSFNDSLTRSIAREARSGGRLALLLFDLDHFKQINDNHGHPAGDEALRRASRLLESSLRRGDLAARYGGEEFAAILPGADEEGGVRQAERVRQAIAKEPLLFEGARIEMRASFGVAVWPEAGDDSQALVDAADRALYAAKQGGRNRVVAASALVRAAIESTEPPA